MNKKLNILCIGKCRKLSLILLSLNIMSIKRKQKFKKLNKKKSYKMLWVRKTSYKKSIETKNYMLFIDGNKKSNS